MRKQKKGITYPCCPEEEAIKGNKSRPDYHPGYQGFRCRMYLVRENTVDEPIEISGQNKAYNLVKEELSHCDREIMLSILLTAQNTLIGVETVAVGSVQSCALTAADVFKGALCANAASIILCHNHPSGNPAPSQADIRLTESMREAGKLMGINILDHLIIGHEGYRSINN